MEWKKDLQVWFCSHMVSVLGMIWKRRGLGFLCPWVGDAEWVVFSACMFPLSFCCVFQIFCHKILSIAVGVLLHRWNSLQQKAHWLRKLSIMGERGLSLRKIIWKHVHMEACSHLHWNQSKLQAVASKLQLVESCSCPASHLPMKIIRCFCQCSSLHMPVLAYLARVGRHDCVHFQEDEAWEQNMHQQRRGEGKTWVLLVGLGLPFWSRNLGLTVCAHCWLSK